MATESQIQKERDDARRRRQPPSVPMRIEIPFAGDGGFQVPADDALLELTLHVTDDDGETAPWFDDYWWTELINTRGNQPMMIHVAPTPYAMLHAIVLHLLDMVARIAPQWRLIGHAYRDDLVGIDCTTSIVTSAYHEIRIIDGERSVNVAGSRGIPQLGLDEIFGQIRREQLLLDRPTPTLVRVPANETPAASTRCTGDVSEKETTAL